MHGCISVTKIIRSLGILSAGRNKYAGGGGLSFEIITLSAAIHKIYKFLHFNGIVTMATGDLRMFYFM